MNELNSPSPAAPPPPSPSPVEPEPSSPAAEGRVPDPFVGGPQPLPGGGCSKPALIGCGIFFLLLGLVGIFFILRAKDLLSWSLGSLTPAVLQNAAPEVTPADRERFSQAVVAARERIEKGQLDPVALQALQGRLMKAAQSGAGKLPRSEFLLLTEAFEKIGRAGEEAPDATPSPAQPPAADPLPAPAP